MIKLTGKNITMENVFDVAYRATPVCLSEEAKQKMDKSRQLIRDRLEKGDVIYGVNTGFGHFSNIKISNEQIIELQKNLIRSHCVGLGPAFTKEQSRAILYLRAVALARGHSGVRPLVVETLLNYLNKDIIPVIPQKGSVGASGDLAPLSHLALAIIGEGQVWGKKGKKLPVQKLLEEKSVSPLELKEKEGLSMINGCQVMTALGLIDLYKARNLIWLADLCGAMSLEAIRGTRSAFDPLISASRPHPGEIKTAGNLLKLIGNNSEISKSHSDCKKVQDPYSFRCIPAVHGAAKDGLRHVLSVLEIEANSSTDNPLVFADENKILSCGNFHGEPVAQALDYACIALSSLGNISECRIQKMINPSVSGLSPFLSLAPGLQSGLMIVQVSSASLVSENKILCHPASVDSIPTSVDKEDHVSMGTHAARKFSSVVENTESILSMELLCASQALDLLKPLKPDFLIEKIHEEIRKQVPFAKKDRVFSEDIQKIKKMIQDNTFIEIIKETTGELGW